MLSGSVSVNSFFSHRVMSFVKGFKEIFSHCLNATATTCEKSFLFYTILSNCLRSLEHTAVLSPAAAVLFPLRMSGLNFNPA